jgi:hypothetical protein
VVLNLAAYGKTWRIGRLNVVLPLLGPLRFSKTINSDKGTDKEKQEWRPKSSAIHERSPFGDFFAGQTVYSAIKINEK